VARDLPAKRGQAKLDALIKALIEGEESGLGRRTIRDIIADARFKLSGSRCPFPFQQRFVANCGARDPDE
jgi:hypothetical protein